MKTKLLLAALVVITATLYASAPISCPFVNTQTGLQCVGVPIPDGVSVAGDKYKCSSNSAHKWVVKR
jgi:hypothetical protein